MPIDTNHLERALRGVVPMGRRNWLFCWTEVGAKYVGIAQSLIATHALAVSALVLIGQACKLGFEFADALVAMGTLTAGLLQVEAHRVAAAALAVADDDLLDLEVVGDLAVPTGLGARAPLRSPRRHGASASPSDTCRRPWRAPGSWPARPCRRPRRTDSG